jgi:hypothetical protein
MDVGSILIGVSGGSVFGTLIKALFDRRKLGADTTAVLTKAATELVEAQAEVVVKPLREQVAQLEAEVHELRRTVRAATTELQACRADNRAKDRVIADLTVRAARREDTVD